MYKKYFEGSEAADNQNSAMGVGVRFKNGWSLCTIKRLIGGRQKKKLIFGTCATIFVAVVSVLIFYGCKKDPNGQGLFSKRLTSQTVSSGMRAFDSMDELFEEVNLLSSMDEDELESYENRIGFQSFGRIAESVYYQILRERAEELGVDELGDNDTELTMSDAQTFVAQYPEYLELKKIIYADDCGYVPENGDEYRFTRKYGDEPFRYIMNEDRMFQVEDMVFRVFEEMTIGTSIENIGALYGIGEGNFGEMLQLYEQESADKGIPFVKIQKGGPDPTPSQQAVSCGTSYGWEIELYSPVTSKKERVKGIFWEYSTYSVKSGGSSADIIYKAHMLVRAERRGVWIWWDVQRTIQTTMNMSICVEGNRIYGIESYNSGSPVWKRERDIISGRMNDVSPIYFNDYIRSLVGSASIATTALSVIKS